MERAAYDFQKLKAPLKISRSLPKEYAVCFQQKILFLFLNAVLAMEWCHRLCHILCGNVAICHNVIRATGSH